MDHEAQSTVCDQSIGSRPQIQSRRSRRQHYYEGDAQESLASSGQGSANMLGSRPTPNPLVHNRPFGPPATDFPSREASSGLGQSDGGRPMKPPFRTSSDGGPGHSALVSRQSLVSMGESTATGGSTANTVDMVLTKRYAPLEKEDVGAEQYTSSALTPPMAHALHNPPHPTSTYGNTKVSASHALEIPMQNDQYTQANHSDRPYRFGNGSATGTDAFSMLAPTGNSLNGVHSQTYARVGMDAMVEGRYGRQAQMPPSFDRSVPSSSRPLEASTGVVLGDWIANDIRNEKPKINEEGLDYSSRSDSLTTVPPPPILEQSNHFSMPGAFRMTSGGVPPAANDSESSLEGSIPSLPTYRVDRNSHYQADRLIEASLVCDQARDEEYPSPPAPLEYGTSMGEATFFTAATTTTASPIVEALPLDEIQTVGAFFRTRKVKCALLLLVFAFAILITGTVYGVTGFKHVQKDDPASKDVQTTPPSASGDINLDYFVNVALPDYSRQALRRENSAQSKALAWLRNNTLLETYSLSRRLERFALATIYFSTGGENRWRATSGWLTNLPECSWFAVRKTYTLEDRGEFAHCDEEGFKGLSLDENDLYGTLPLEIALLSNLEVVEMQRNLITGFLPSTLGELDNLVSCNLFDNYLTGTIPSQLGNLNHLEVLDVEYNYLAQIIPETLGNLGNLQRLLLDRNGLVGSIPSQFGQMSDLEVMYLFSNKMSGTIPKELGNLSKLTDVQWETNLLSGAIPTEVGLWKNLTVLAIGNNTFSGTLPTELGGLSQLSYLDVYRNYLTGTLPTELGLLTNATHLYFETNYFTGRIPTELGDLHGKLRQLWLHSNNLTGNIPTELGQLTATTNMALSFNKLSGRIPTELGLLTDTKSLQLQWNGLTGPIPSELGLLTELNQLKLHWNYLTGEMPGEICQLRWEGKLTNVTVDCQRVWFELVRSHVESWQPNRTQPSTTMWRHLIALVVVLATATAEFQPYELNGGLVCAVAGRDFCVVAADTRMIGANGYHLNSRIHLSDRIWSVDDDTLLQKVQKSLRRGPLGEKQSPQTWQVQGTRTPVWIGSAGCSADCTALRRTVRADLRAARHLGETSRTRPEQVATLLSQTLYSRRNFPYYGFCVTGALDETVGGKVYMYDAIGSYEQVAVASAGTGREVLQPILDRLFGPCPDERGQVAGSADDAVDKLYMAYQAVSEREIGVGDNLVLNVAERGVDGGVTCRVILYPLKHD